MENKLTFHIFGLKYFTHKYLTAVLMKYFSPACRVAHSQASRTPLPRPHTRQSSRQVSRRSARLMLQLTVTASLA